VSTSDEAGRAGGKNVLGAAEGNVGEPTPGSTDRDLSTSRGLELSEGSEPSSEPPEPPDSSAPPEPPNSSEPPQPPESPKPPARFGTLKRVALWSLGTIITVSAAALATIFFYEIDSALSDREPIDVPQVTTGSDANIAPSPAESLNPDNPPIGSFSLYVADTEKLPQSLKSVYSCDTLWQIGVEAGGIEEAFEYSPPVIVTIHGAAKDGALIVDMHARVVKRSSPPPDGALLVCYHPPSLYVVDPVRLSVNLRDGDVTRVKRVGDPREGGDPLILTGRDDGTPSPDGRVSSAPSAFDRDFDYSRPLAQFGEGFAIQLRENEFGQLNISQFPALESVEWVIDAKVATSDGVQTVTLSDNGRNFRTTGYRDISDYKISHMVGSSGTLGPASDVDRDTVKKIPRRPGR